MTGVESVRAQDLGERICGEGGIKGTAVAKEEFVILVCSEGSRVDMSVSPAWKNEHPQAEHDP
jgi:hypothetical protein